MGTLGQVLWVTAAAGIGGTGLGGGAACLLRRDSGRMVSLLLSFAAGVMVAVVCFDLLAEAAPGRLAISAMGILAGYGATAGLNRALELNGTEYQAYFPTETEDEDEENPDNGLIILKVLHEDGEDLLSTCDTEEELEVAYDAFMEELFDDEEEDS